jgi:hypothetical protein
VKALRVLGAFLWLPAFAGSLAYTFGWGVTVSVIAALCAIPFGAWVATVIAAQIARANTVWDTSRDEVAPPVVWDRQRDAWDRNTDGTYAIRAVNSDGCLQHWHLSDIAREFGPVTATEPTGPDGAGEDTD